MSCEQNKSRENIFPVTIKNDNRVAVSITFQNHFIVEKIELHNFQKFVFVSVRNWNFFLSISTQIYILNGTIVSSGRP